MMSVRSERMIASKYGTVDKCGMDKEAHIEKTHMHMLLLGVIGWWSLNGVMTDRYHAPGKSQGTAIRGAVLHVCDRARARCLVACVERLARNLW